MPSTSSRASLVAEIERLHRQLEQLEQLDQSSASSPACSSPGSPIASTSRLPPIKKKQKQKMPLGPLPASLASAPKRHIALLFTYEGWSYSGLAYQPASTPTTLPTVEGVLLDALVRARLIEPYVNEDGFGCGFERCGRTDAGVSSSGQVVNLWIRSDLADPMKTGDPTPEAVNATGSDTESASSGEATSATAEKVNGGHRGKRPASVELPYVTLLNRQLPDSVRILAWSPVSASFSSRFSCIWRHYKYFFSSSVTAPILRDRFDFGAAYAQLDHSSPQDEARPQWQENLASIDWKGLNLDVDLMRDAVRRLVGEHDFRNFCRIDPPKQLISHQRKVISATIDAVEGEGSDMFVLNLRGSAFLYNQVRTIIALLFLVGARLEPPSVVERLLWTSDRTLRTEAMHPVPPGTTREEIDAKPGFEIGDDLPLILWQCGFNDSEFDWRLDSGPREEPVRPGEPKRVSINPVETFRTQYLKMNEAYTEQRLKAIVIKHHLASYCQLTPPPPTEEPEYVNQLIYTPLGMGRTGKSSTYIPLLERQRADLPEVQNAKWAAGRGKKRMMKREENRQAADQLRQENLEKKRQALEAHEKEIELARSSRERGTEGVEGSASR